ncbi:hypothetical protein [Abyssisolibacter fermentans]|uniref:hypothetical protein n=1 Tax=Abyssisolibacter fermentans TaxID=1766203 RepID=UPI000829E687|nr:hypothetical protein [Abyssisolibacter fermentans]
MMDIDIHAITFRGEIFGFSPANGVILRLNRQLEEIIRSKKTVDLNIDDNSIKAMALLNKWKEKNIIKNYDDIGTIYDFSNLIKINCIKFKKNKLTALKTSKKIMKYWNTKPNQIRFASMKNDLEVMNDSNSNSITYHLNDEIDDSMICQIDDEISRLVSNCYIIPSKNLIDNIKILSKTFSKGNNIEKIINMKSLKKIINCIKQNKRRVRKCDSGTTSCFVNDDGQLYKCEKCISKQYQISDLSQFKKTNTIYENETCSRCYARFICGGVCPVVCKHDDYYCQCMKETLSLAIKILIFLEMDEIKS